MTKETLMAAAKNVRTMTPGVRAAIEKLTPKKLPQEEVDDIEGDWLVAEVQLAQMENSNTDKAIRTVHEMVRKLLCHIAAE